MKKKLAALVLAATMVMASGLTALAADTEITDMTGAGTGAEVTGESDINLPIIKVTVPSSANIVINPFKMAYDGDDTKGVPAGNSQVISAKQQISSASNVPVAVNVTELKATTGDGITVSTTDVSKATAKSIFLWLEVAEEGKLDADPKNVGKITANRVAIPKATEDGKVKAGAKNGIVTLAAGTDDAPVKADFIIGGTVVPNPVITEKENNVTTTKADPWTAADTISISFKFTFSPQSVETPAAP